MVTAVAILAVLVIVEAAAIIWLAGENNTAGHSLTGYRQSHHRHCRASGRGDYEAARAYDTRSTV